MPTLDARVTGFVPGDDLSRRVTIDRDGGGNPDEALEAGVTIAKAWLTIKARLTDADVDALVQKVVTTVNQVGIGQVENDGTGDVDAVLRFDLTPADTLAIGLRLREFDVQVLTSGAKVYTVERGTINATRDQVTISAA